jgi:hypothetical protein
MELLPLSLDAQHLGLYEVRIKAIMASRLGVFGTGCQMEDELMESIRSKSPEAAKLVENSISAYRRWFEAEQGKADKGVIDNSREQAFQSSKELESYVRTHGVS